MNSVFSKAESSGNGMDDGKTAIILRGFESIRRYLVAS